MESLAFWKEQLVHADEIVHNVPMSNEHPDYLHIMEQAAMYAQVIVTEIESEVLK
jgi:hypothetical protein